VLRFFILLLSLLLVSLEADNKKDGLAYLNTIREHAGLIKFKPNKALEKAATAHAKYLIRNQTKSHYEKKGRSSFTGTTPSKRVLKAGYPTAFVMENLSTNTKGYQRSIESIFSAIYHRFAFFSFDKDEIGFGSALGKKKRKINRAYVYNIGSSAIADLCSDSFSMTYGMYYVKDICKQSSKMIPKSLIDEKKDQTRRKNGEIILYPYAGQRGIWPAFYNESPDPLPGYKVSGFPISVQFNPVRYNTIELKSFRLYDASGKEIKETKILQQKNDQNHLFTKFEFALMPLKRLEFDTTYTAHFEAVADGRKVKRRWAFKTTKPEETLFRITKNKSKLNVKAGSTVVLYIVPNTKKDVMSTYISRGGIKVSFLDQNTLKVTFPKKRSSGRVSLEMGKRKIFFDVE